MKFNIPRALSVIVIGLYGCAGFFNDLLDHDTVLVSFKVEKSKNPTLTGDYEGYVDTYGKRVVVDFKQASISSTILKSLIPTVIYTSREISPSADLPVDLNGTLTYELKTLRKTSEWKISACCLNTGSGPVLSYTDDWEHTMATGSGDHMGFGDGIIKSDGTSEKLYFIGVKNGGANDLSYMEKLNLTTGTPELANTVPWIAKSLGDKYLTPAFYLSLYDGSTTYIRQVNTNTLNHTLEATLPSLQNVSVLSVPNSGGTRVKGITGTVSGDARTFNIYDPAGETALLDCGVGTTETFPILGDTDYVRQTYFMIGTSINCGAIGSGTDIFVSRWDNSFGMLWKTTLWSTNNDFLPSIGNKRNLIVLPDGGLIVERFWSTSGIYNAPGKFDINGNDITSTTNFPNFPAYYLSRSIILVSMALYDYNSAQDIFYAAYNTSTGVYSVHRSDINGNIRQITFASGLTVGCNPGQSTITVSVDLAYNLYFNCLKTNSITGLKDMYVKKFRATVTQ